MSKKIESVMKKTKKTQKTSQKGEIQNRDFTGEFYSTFKELIPILSSLKTNKQTKKKTKRKKCFQIHFTLKIKSYTLNTYLHITLEKA